MREDKGVAWGLRIELVAACLVGLLAAMGMVGLTGPGTTAGRAPAADAGTGVVSAAGVPGEMGSEVGLANAPPMGWNGYNHWGRSVTAVIVEQEAKALVTSGLAAAGYRYVNLDGGWDQWSRDKAGNLQADPTKFPQGIKAVADYVHALGLKFGVYTSAGEHNCAHTTAGSYGHYAQDAREFASWGVDYLKLDWCWVPFNRYPGMSHQVVGKMLAQAMKTALVATGRPMVFDINDTWVPDAGYIWGRGIGNMRRTTYDIADSFASMLTNFRVNVNLGVYSGPHDWCDPDMLEVGNGGMTASEDQAHFSLWAEMAAPLIAGNDVANMSAQTAAILGNREVIAVDQDPLGDAGKVVWSKGGLWVLAKPLADGEVAVVLFNSTNKAAVMNTSALGVGLGHTPSYRLSDLWSGTVVRTTGAVGASVPAHGVVMYRVEALVVGPGRPGLD